MIQMKTEHPGFDLPTEILCSIPVSKHPKFPTNFAPMSMLVEDFGLHVQADLKPYFDAIRAQHGISIRGGTVPEYGRIAWVHPTDKLTYDYVIGTYWQDVRPDTEAVSC